VKFNTSKSLATVGFALSALALSLNSFAAPWAKITDKEIAGTVTGPKGPEAGVWVIAETKDLPTPYAKVVSTDDQGRFVIPELPKAKYTVWVRGYGLVDSPKTAAKPGQELTLKAVPAPTEKDAAKYYPGMYWYSMIDVPKASEFPGTGEKGNGIPTFMKTQAYWLDTMKNSCQSCHALGTRGIREVPEYFKSQSPGDGFGQWAHRTQAGQAMVNMALALGRLGPERGLSMYANWTDRIAKGETPFAKPERPQGIERNAVYTMWDWSTPKHYMHDAISTDKRNPTLNANGLIYGASEESTDLVPTLDPVHNIAGAVRMPYAAANTPSSTSLPRSQSAYWGDEPIWDGHDSIHNLIWDERGLLWFAARNRGEDNPDFCKKGSSHPSAQLVPLNKSVRHLSVYDPKTSEWVLISTCFTTQHLYFGRDKNDTLWTSAGGAAAPVVGWLNTKMFLETRDEQKSQGWTPLIIDTNGNGKRDEYVEAKDPLDPTKDKRIIAGFYGVQSSTVDDSIWGQSMDVGFSRIDQPSYIIRLNPGSDPTHTALAEVYQPPQGTFGARGLDIDSKGVVWTVLSSGHIASFDRSKCKGPLNGPTAAEGKHCEEGWTLYKLPGPQFKNVDDKNASADGAYYIWVDLYNTLGLGKDVPIASSNGGEALVAVVNGKTVTMRVPYPLGFFTKNVDGRIDDANKGWKGRGLWTTSGTRANFHSGDGNKETSPKVFKIQIRPDPLAF
jgi:hypothetical protein